MQAIVTRYHGPGNVKGSRVSARCDSRRIEIPWDDAVPSHMNHRLAMRVLCDRMGWKGYRWVSGHLPGGKGALVWTTDGVPHG